MPPTIMRYVHMLSDRTGVSPLQLLIGFIFVMLILAGGGARPARRLHGRIMGQQRPPNPEEHHHTKPPKF